MVRAAGHALSPSSTDECRPALRAKPERACRRLPRPIGADERRFAPTLGRLLTHTVKWIAASSRDPMPMPVGIVASDDGTRLLCQLAGFDAQRLRAGVRVRLVFRQIATDAQGQPRYGHKAAPILLEDRLPPGATL